jgi:hypothetical protein
MATTEKTNNISTSTEPPTNVSAVQAGRGRIVSLVIGDTLAFIIFAVIGRSSHGESVSPGSILQILLTAAPFAAGWFMVAPFLGAFRRDITDNPRKMVTRTLLAWVCAWPVAMALRGIFVDHGVPPVSFAIITLIFNTFILNVWRGLYAFYNSLKGRRR